MENKELSHKKEEKEKKKEEEEEGNKEKQQKEKGRRSRRRGKGRCDIGKRKGIGGSKSQTKKFEYDENRLYIYTKYLLSIFIMNICFKTF